MNLLIIVPIVWSAVILFAVALCTAAGRADEAMGCK
jgi:hypothetical protein